ncbi:MAG: hypothetical protein ACTSU5_09630 [Promethearchaeota archaeon]
MTERITKVSKRGFIHLPSKIRRDNSLQEGASAWITDEEGSGAVTIYPIKDLEPLRGESRSSIVTYDILFQNQVNDIQEEM